MKPFDATRDLAKYALELDVGQSAGDLDTASRRVLADEIGVLFAASRHSAVETALRAMPLSDSEQRGTVIGHGRGARPEIAAFINGIGGHDIELDDSHAPSLSHPAAVIVPAALAVAEETDADLGTLLSAIAAAYDVQARVSQAMGTKELHHRGFHPSAVCGAIGAAVAAGRICGLSLEEMRSAIGLAASQSSGLTTYYDDPYHMSKSFQTGVAARNGVTAALFARQGFGAAPDVLTGPHDVIRPFGGDSADAAKLVADLGTRFEITRTSLKRHACCNQTHAAVDALLTLIDEHGLRPADIGHINVQLSHSAVPGVDRNKLWTHNIQYVMALTAHQRFIGPHHFAPEWTGNAEITELAERVSLTGSDLLESRFPEKKGAIVTVTQRDGRRHELEADAPMGSPGRPLTQDVLRDKFEHLAGSVLDAGAASRLWSRLMSMRLDEGVAELYDVLQRAPDGRILALGR